MFNMIVQYKSMNNPYFDYSRQKILKELFWLRRGFKMICWAYHGTEGHSILLEEINRRERKIELDKLLKKAEVLRDENDKRNT